MFGPIVVPYEAVMLFNIITLKPEFTIDDVELALGELCNVVKETYGNDEGGFIAGQVFKYSGFLSKEGSLGNQEDELAHLAILTYWKSFDQHETSHADQIFKEKFSAIAEFCTDTRELGYELLWQGSVKKIEVSD